MEEAIAKLKDANNHHWRGMAALRRADQADHPEWWDHFDRAAEYEFIRRDQAIGEMMALLTP